jgi:hypothetical protein
MGLQQPSALRVGARVLRQPASQGKGHQAALRALGNRWLELLWHCPRKGICYDEAVHVANRNRALGSIAAAA